MHARRLVLVSVAMVLAAGGAAEAAIQDFKQVQATGASSVKDDARAQEEALRDAWRNAVEKAVGVYVDSKTLAEGDDVLSDKIFTQSKGYIHEYKIAQRGRKPDGLYEVTISAVVSEKQLVADLEMLLAAKGRPKIGLLVVEKIDGKPITGRPVYTRLSRFMELKGYEMVSTDYLIATQAAGPQFDALMKHPIKAAGLAKKAGIEVLVLCRASSQYRGTLKTWGDIQAPQYFSQLNVQAVRASNGATLYSETMDFDPGRARQRVRLGTTSAGQAAVKALQLVTDDILPVMNIRILQKWGMEMTQGTRIQLVVKGLSFGQRLKLKRALEAIKGVRQVTQGRFSKQESLIDVYAQLTAEQLATHLYEGVKDPALEVTGVEEGKITLAVKPGP